MSKIKELLRVNDEEVGRVRKMYGKTEEDIEEDVDILLDWLDKQPHLPKPHERARLERLLLRNKFRIERTKAKLDDHYTFKVLHPEFYSLLNPDSDVAKNLKKSVIIAPMPKLLPNLERLCFCQFRKGEEENYNFLNQLRYMIMVWELQLTHDYSAAEILIWDFKHLSFKHILRLDVNLMQKALSILQRAFSARMARIEYVNVNSSLFDIALAIIKQITDVKLLERVGVHKDEESLHKSIPREYLPEEVGGTAGSAREISDRWDEELVLQWGFLEAQAARVSNQRMRVGKPMEDDLFGVEGTFRKINLD